GFAGLLARVGRGLPLGQGLAVGAEGAFAAAGSGAGAEGGPQVHDRLGVVGHPGARGVGLGDVPQVGGDLAVPRPAGNGAVAGQHPLDVAVEDGGPLAEGDGENRPRRGAADARQGGEAVEGVGKPAAVFSCDDLGRPGEVAGAGVVAEAGPQVQHGVEGRRGEGLDSGRGGGEAGEVGHHRGHLGLLQHDLRQPHPVGGDVPLPGQVLAAVVVEPAEQAAGELAVAGSGGPGGGYAGDVHYGAIGSGGGSAIQKALEQPFQGLGLVVVQVGLFLDLVDHLVLHQAVDEGLVGFAAAGARVREAVLAAQGDIPVADPLALHQAALVAGAVAGEAGDGLDVEGLAVEVDPPRPPYTQVADAGAVVVEVENAIGDAQGAGEGV